MTDTINEARALAQTIASPDFRGLTTQQTLDVRRVLATLAGDLEAARAELAAAKSETAAAVSQAKHVGDCLVTCSARAAAAEAELAAARPDFTTWSTIRDLVNGDDASAGDRSVVRAWLERLDRLSAYHAAHPAASPAAEAPHAAASRLALDALAQMGPEEARRTFVDAGIVDERGRLTEAYASAPDLPEPCAVCSEALCECGTGRAGGGGHE